MYFAKNEDVKIDLTEMLQNLIALYFDHNYESISEILKIENDKKSSNNIPLNRYYNKGMVFCEDDNPLITVRINVDEEIKYPLNTLLMISSNLIDEKKFISLIINKWIEKFKVYGILNNNKITNIIGKERYIQLNVGKNSWENLSKACKNKNITLKVGFKMVVLEYINEICSQ